MLRFIISMPIQWSMSDIMNSKSCDNPFITLPVRTLNQEDSNVNIQNGRLSTEINWDERVTTSNRSKYNHKNTKLAITTAWTRKISNLILYKNNISWNQTLDENVIRSRNFSQISHYINNYFVNIAHEFIKNVTEFIGPSHNTSILRSRNRNRTKVVNQWKNCPLLRWNHSTNG